ncbi:hypothetical protein V7111_22810, partial [Neobacillus niacini]
MDGLKAQSVETVETRYSTVKKTSKAEVKSNISKIQRLKRDKWLYLLLIPGLVYFIIFKYLPMWGIVISFQN